MRASLRVPVWILVSLCAGVVTGEPLTTRWSTLLRPSRGSPQARELPMNGPIRSLPEFQFKGPRPAHPFMLGNFAADGQFGLRNGGIEQVTGRNAAVRLVETADQFELEGRITMKDFGGWFMLLGWNEDTGNGYLVHNCTMRESGAPWFISELRGRQTVEDTTQEIMHQEWKQSQEFRVTVKEGQLTFQVGAMKILNADQLPNYQAGSVIFGVYDTRYGPRPVRIESLRVRALDPAAAPMP